MTAGPHTTLPQVARGFYWITHIHAAIMDSESRSHSPTYPAGKTAAGHDHGSSVHDLDKKAEWRGDEKASMAGQGKGRRQQQPGIDTGLDRWRLVATIIMAVPIVWALVVALAGRGAAGIGIPFDAFRFLGGLGGLGGASHAATCETATFSALQIGRAHV